MTNKNLVNLTKLIKIIEKLRDPKDGCPWDLGQDNHSLLKYLIEECYEFVSAVEKNSNDQMKDELGDVLLQVILQAQIFSEDDKFDLDEVAFHLCQKLKYRHPHVFKKIDKKITPQKVKENWKALKEAKIKDFDQDDIPFKLLNFPALMAACKIGQKSKDVQFDWDTPQEVWKKVNEELKELSSALKESAYDNSPKVSEELGDLLFTLGQMARHLNIDPEDCLRKANTKFLKRYQKMRVIIKGEKKKNKKIKELSSEEKEFFWNKAKYAQDI